MLPFTERTEREMKESTLQHAESPEPTASFFITNKTELRNCARCDAARATPSPNQGVKPRAYLLFLKGKRKHQLPHPVPRTISLTSSQHIGLVMRFVMTKHFQQHSRTRKPLVTSAKFPPNKVSQLIVLSLDALVSITCSC